MESGHVPVLTTAEQQTSGRLLGPPSLDDFGWDREAGPDAPLVGPWFGDHSFGEVRVSGAGGGLVFEAFGFGDQPSMLLASACREVTKSVPSGVLAHVSRALGGMGEHELRLNVVFDGRASRADLVRALLGFVTHPSPAAYRENPVHLRVTDRSGNTPDMTTGPQPAAAPASAGELYPPPAADLLELVAKCGSASAEERLEAATLIGRVGSGDTRSTQLAQSRLTQLLLDRSPAVVEAAWNSLGVLAEQDNELAATLRVLTRVCAGRRDEESESRELVTGANQNLVEAKTPERPLTEALLHELQGLRQSLIAKAEPTRDQFQDLLNRMAGISFGTSNRHVVSLVNSISELLGVGFVDPTDQLTKAIFVFVPSGAGSGNIVLRKKGAMGKQESISNRTRFPDAVVIRGQNIAEDNKQ